MGDFRYGPVELFLVGFEGERPTQAVIDALRATLETGAVRLLDFIIVSRDAEGEITVTEIEDDPEHFGLADLELGALGITGSEDVDELAPQIQPGHSAALVAFELVYQRELASQLAASGAVVLATERIPAPAINALIDDLDNENEGD